MPVGSLIVLYMRARIICINANMHTICIYTCTRVIVNGTRDDCCWRGFQGCWIETFLLQENYIEMISRVTFVH